MKQKNQPAHVINEKIRLPQVRVIDANGANLGTMSSREALNIANEQQLDLVLLSDKADPPVCRIINYGKFKYEQEKQRTKQAHKTKLKELNMRYTIEDHDYTVRVNQAKRFLQSGDQVKATITLRGRETQHSDLAVSLLQRMASDLQEYGQIQQTPKREGGRVIMLVVPKNTSASVSKKEAPKQLTAKV